VAGIDRGVLIPLMRPSEAVLVLVVAGALVGAYVRVLTGHQVRLRLRPIDGPLLTFVLLSSLWPVASLLLRRQVPGSDEMMAVLPVCKLAALLLLVRMTVRSEQQLLRCIRVIAWTACGLAVLAVLQTIRFGPVITLLS